MDLFTEMADDLGEVFVEGGKEITWQGRTFRALVSEPLVDQVLEAGGFSESVRFTVKLLRADIPAIPQHGDLMTFSGTEYRIRKVSNRPPHPLVTLELEDKDQ